MDTRLSHLLNSISLSGTQWLGLRRVKSRTFIHAIRDGKPELNAVSLDEGVMVEVLVDGQFGYAGTNSLHPAQVQAAAERAYRDAKAAAKHAIFSFTPEQRPSVQGEFISPRTLPSGSLPTEALDLLVELTNSMHISDKIVKATAMATVSELEIDFVSSNGSAIHQNFAISCCDLQVVAQDGPVVQKRSLNGPRGITLQAGLELFSAEKLRKEARRIAEEAIELLTAEECPSGTLDLVLAPDQLMLQIHESIGHALELDRILGDERNYAGWSFVQPQDFGKLQYGSELLNVTFDPSVQTELASYGFDDSGLPATKEFIIKNGILQRGLGGLESQARSGLPGVANFRACSWNRAPIDRMANLNIEPGNASWDEIIGSIENGVYMEANRSWSIDDYRKKFQFGCEYGKLIRNGKIVKTIRNPNYRGIAVPFWNSLFKVGDAATFGIFGTPNCGKGEPNQTIWVGHASPVCAFKNVEVFGGVQ